MDRENHPYSSLAIAERMSEKRPPFKLCFPKDQLLGRSNFRAFKLEDEPITPKFYSTKYENQNEDKKDKESETLKKAADREENICKLVNRKPLLTSHAYGWWYEQGVRPIESRINFRKRTSDLVNFQMKIYAEDQKLKNLKQ